MPRRTRIQAVVLALAAACGLPTGCGPGPDRKPVGPAASPETPGTRDRDAGDPGTVATAMGGPYLFDRVIALCVGIETYGHVAEAPFAEADARAVGEILRDRYGYAADVTLLGKRATKAAILGKIDEYARTLGERDCFILFFAGHGEVINLPREPGGAPARDGFLIPYEASVALGDHRNPEDWRREAIGMRDLVGRLGSMKARHALAIVDACCSGFMAMRGSLKARHDLHYYLANPSRAVLAATTDDQPATPDEARGHGRFTAALLDELAHWADERKEAASLTDVFQGVGTRVRSASSGPGSARSPMIPMMNTRLGDGGGEFVFIPKSVRKSDVDFVARLASGAGASGESRGHALSGVMARTQDRENLRTTERDVIEAYDALDYRYGVAADREAARWTAVAERHAAQAAAGDPLAMAALYYCYRDGLGAEKSPESAHRWAALACESGTPAGKHALGDCYADGTGVPANRAVADVLFRDAARGGFPPGKLAVAATTLEKLDAAARGERVEYAEGELARMREELSGAAESGLARARRSLSALLIGGKGGFDPDPARAVRLLEDAARGEPASLGSAYAGVVLAELLRKGVPGVLDPDPGRAVAELRRAASAGLAFAQRRLAWACYEGADMPVDDAQAFLWADLADRQGDAEASVLLYEMYAAGRGTPADPVKARELLEKGARAGSAEANLRLGVTLLEEGRDEAMAHLIRAGDLGIPEGWYAAGQLFWGRYRAEELKTPDDARASLPEGRDARMAALYLMKAARAGHPRARSYLGMQPPRAIDWATEQLDQQSK